MKMISRFLKMRKYKKDNIRIEIEKGEEENQEEEVFIIM